MKKNLNYLLSLVLFLSFTLNFTITVRASNFESLAKARIFEEIKIDGNTLNATETKEATVKISEFEVSRQEFVLVGEIDNELQFNVQAEIVDNEIITPQDITGNYNVISIYSLSDFTRIILSDKQLKKMFYVDISKNNNTEVFYNKYWYTEILESNIIESDGDITTYSYHTAHDKTIKRSYNIYGDVYEEVLVLLHSYNWPDTSSGNGEFFKVTNTVKEKYTNWRPSGGSLRKLTGCSLSVAGAKVEVDTDAGEYVESIKTYHTGYKVGTGLNVDIQFWVDIPNVPLGITGSYGGSVRVGEADNNYYSFELENAGTKKVKEASVEWDDYKFHLKNVGDYFKAEIYVATVKGVSAGQRLNFKVNWKYDIISDGINQGHGTPTYYEPVTFPNTLQYSMN